jgi:hypothetical protein
VSGGLITREHAIAAARNALRGQGYAVVVHGSQIRDLDLLAIPWRATALDAFAVAEIVAHAVAGSVQLNSFKQPNVSHKPHGRVAFVIELDDDMQYGFDRWYIDLSVMPRTEDVRDRIADGSFGAEDEPEGTDDA